MQRMLWSGLFSVNLFPICSQLGTRVISSIYGNKFSDESSFLHHQQKEPLFSGSLFRRSWLRGRDLNPRPLGYEPNEMQYVCGRGDSTIRKKLCSESCSISAESPENT